MKSRNSCEFFRNFLLRIFNISQKIAKFDFESDIQKSSFSWKLDKNNWTRKIGLSHPGTCLRSRKIFWKSGLCIVECWSEFCQGEKSSKCIHFEVWKLQSCCQAPRVWQVRYFVSPIIGDTLSSYLALWGCRVMRILLKSSQKSGCSFALRRQFIGCRTLSSEEDLLLTKEL